MAASSLNQSGLLFVPRGWQRASAVQWLKKIHAWTGFWGALFFFAMGVSGALLNHRNIWKIETGEPVEVSAMNIAVGPGAIADQKALGRWAKKELGLASEPKPPRKEGGPEGEGGKKKFMGKERAEPAKWAQQFMHPNGRVTVEYVPGSASVSVRQDAQNLFGFIKNMHKGTGLDIGWVLFLDSVAGALITMSLTGFLLWSRLHGPRLAAGGLVFASLGLAVAAVWPHLI